MTKQEFVDQVASEADLSKSDAGRAVEAALAVIQDTLQRGGEVNLTGSASSPSQSAAPAKA